MGIEAVAKKLIRFGAITSADRARCAEKGPAGEADADRDEGLFCQTAFEFLPPVLFIEVSGFIISDTLSLAAE